MAQATQHPPLLDTSLLDAAQREFFYEFGYLHMPALFTAQESAHISEEFNRTVDKFIPPPFALETEAEHALRVGSRGAGEAHTGERRTMIGGPIEHRMMWLLDHPKILGLLRGLLGTDFCYCSGDGNYYSGDTGWHPDGGVRLKQSPRLLTHWLARHRLLLPLHHHAACLTMSSA